jgi:hypothetical protein
MAKRARSSTSVPESHSAESILALIDSLDRDERKKLFDQLAFHRDNEHIAALLAKSQRMADVMPMIGHYLEELQCSRGGQDRNSRLKILLERFLGVAKEVRGALEQWGEAWSQSEQRLERYKKGPNVRKRPANERKDLLSQYLGAGIKDPKEILATLEQHAPELARIDLKTLRNILSELRRARPSPS